VLHERREIIPRLAQQLLAYQFSGWKDALAPLLEATLRSGRDKPECLALLDRLGKPGLWVGFKIAIDRSSYFRSSLARRSESFLAGVTGGSLPLAMDGAAARNSDLSASSGVVLSISGVGVP
jgi:hypothetical protein